jgi:glyoxylase-like metal-dependent hydrolase (beta-lactamase superfamily II)
MTAGAEGETGILHPFLEPPASGEATEVADGVLWLRLPLPMALDHVNVFALRDVEGWTLIDTGLHSKRGIALWQALLDGPLAGAPVRRVLVSHHHPDHIGMAGWFQSRGAELLMPRTAWLYARMLTLDVQTLPPPETVAFWRGAGMPADMLADRSQSRPFNFADIVAPMPLGFTRIAEGDILTLGNRRWQVRMGDGHAPEHATLWSLDDNLILGGDQFLPGISPNIGVYPTEPDADPLADWLRATRAFRPLAQDSHLVLPGHKLPFTGLPLRLRQMEENHTAALPRLLDHLSEPRTAADCFPVLFRRPIGPAEFPLAMAESVAHLNHLLRLGQVSRTLSEDGAWLWTRAD